MAAPSPRHPSTDIDDSPASIDDLLASMEDDIGKLIATQQRSQSDAHSALDTSEISVVVPERTSPPKPSKANFGIFLEKLPLRRKRVECSYACRSDLQFCFEDLAKSCRTHGQVPLDRIEDLLGRQRTSWQHLRHIDEQVLLEVADIAKAYSRPGDGLVDMEELLSGALRVKPGLLSCYKWLLLKVLMLIVCLFLPSAVLCSMAGWSFLDAMYFAILTIALVGVPDSMPETTSSKIFVILYIPLSIGVAIWILTSFLSKRFAELEKEVRVLFGPDRHQNISRDATWDKSKVHRGRLALEDLLGSPARRPSVPISWESEVAKQPEKSNCPCIWSLGLAAFLLCLILSSAAAVYVFRAPAGAIARFQSADELLDALLWSITTCTTVGFPGPIPGVEDVQFGRILTLLVVVAAVIPAWCLLLRHLSLQLAQASFRRIQDESRSWPLCPEILAYLDADGRGINKMEFMCAMLLVLDKITPDDLWKILAQFEQLDVNRTGLLTSTELAMLKTGSSQQSVQRSPPRKRSEEAQELLPTAARSDGEGKLQPTVSVASSSTDVTARGAVRQHQDSSSSDSQGSMLEKLFQQGIDVQEQLEQKGMELEAALQAQREAEAEVRNALAEQFSLQGKVDLLQAKIGELKVSMEKEREHWDQATQKQCEELSSQLAESEKLCRHWEQVLFETEAKVHLMQDRHQQEITALRRAHGQVLHVERGWQKNDRQLKEAEYKCGVAEQRCKEFRLRAERAELLQAQEEERALRAEAQAQYAQEKAEQFLQLLQNMEEQWQAKMHSLAHEFQKRYETQDLEMRQLEMDIAIKSALVELQAYAYQQAGVPAVEEPRVLPCR